MKKLSLILCLPMLTLISCTKDYSCTCTLGSETYTYDLKDVKKKDVDEACDLAGEVWVSAGGKCNATEI